MRRLLLSLAACALLAACAVESPTTDPAASMPEATPYELPLDSMPELEGPDEYGNEEPSTTIAGRRRSIYDAPRAKVKCPMPAVDEGDKASMLRYMEEFSGCLDRLWEHELRQVNMHFVPPEREFVRKRVRHPICGTMPLKGSDGTYCAAAGTYFILLDDSRRPWQAWAAAVIAHEYGHHVQYLARILDYQERMLEAATTDRTKNLVNRRLELQAECLAGVALQAMREQLPPWEEFQHLYSGSLAKKWAADHGRLSTQYRWMRKGFRSGKPAACNTWSPPARTVT